MFVVTLPRSAEKNPKAFALKAKRAGADVLEIRSDLTPHVRKFTSPLPILVAVRGKDTNLIERLEPAYVDFEAAPSPAFAEATVGRPGPSPRLLLGQRGEGRKFILSFHDYKKTLSLKSLRVLSTRMAEQKPWVVKIATHIVEYKDLKTLIDLQTFLKRKKIRSIVLGMGPKAHLTRILSPYKNVFTYASLDGFESSAIGQLPLSFYKFTSGRRNPKIFGIIGGPSIVASSSPLLHNALFQRHKIDALYSCFPTEEFRKTMGILSKIGVVGGSVTAPFKRNAFLIAKKRDKISKTLRVSNTLRKTRTGWNAWNTDSEGIEKGYPILASARTIAILGAGGAVPSVIRAARNLNPKVSITVFVRDRKKAKKSLASLHIKSLEAAADHRCDVVICAISEDVILPIPKAKTAIDLRYGKRTRFLLDAEKQGIRTTDGVPMLTHQALKQLYYFTGKAAKKDDAEYLHRMLKRHS